MCEGSFYNFTMYMGLLIGLKTQFSYDLGPIYICYESGEK